MFGREAIRIDHEMSVLWEKILRPLLFRLDAEFAHDLGIEALEAGFASPFYVENSSYSEFGEIERFGLKFANPLGIAAGFDKNGIVVNQLASLGWGSVEVGTVTVRPRKGNPKPRLFRLPDDHALINRLGFNNDGAAAVANRIKPLRRKCVIGVNIGKNRDVPIEEAVGNYLAAFEAVHSSADYVAVNVSSPNTPNLREMQRVDRLNELFERLQQRNTELGFKPLLVKIAPDLGEQDLEAIVGLCGDHNISGIIATNTTVSRDDLKTREPVAFGPGGLSGRPLARRSNEVIAEIYRKSKGKLPIVGVGGVFTAEDAFEKIEIGASLIQVYTGFVYGGPTFARDINTGLASILRSKDFASLDEAVGSKFR